jgi:hypothetical protein
MSHEGRTPPHPGPHPALTAGQRLVAAAKEARAIARGEAEPAAVHVPPDWRHPGPRYLQPDTEWPERAECNFEVTR